MNPYKIFLLLFAVALLISGCKKKDPTEPANPPLLGDPEGLVITIVNNSGLPDSVIFFSCMGQTHGKDTNTVWVDGNNTIIPVSMADNTVLHDGTKYTHYARSLASNPVIKLKDNLYGARIRFSVNSPLWMKITSANPHANYSEPSFYFTNDPNYEIIFDKVEFSYTDQKLWMNTTAVDFFGIPYTLTATVNGTTYHIGTSASRKDVFSYFKNVAPVAFHELIQGDYRIVAPALVPPQDFNQHYFDSYIDSVWNKYKGNDSLVLKGEIPANWRAAGVVNSGNQLVFRVKSPSADFNNKTVTINKPPTMDVFGCKGTLNPGGPLPDQKIIPLVAAALNRTVLYNYDANNACDTAKFYKDPTTNWFSKIMHKVSVNNKCYGFANDDVCDQSSLFPPAKITELTITIMKFQ